VTGDWEPDLRLNNSILDVIVGGDGLSATTSWNWDFSPGEFTLQDCRHNADRRPSGWRLHDSVEEQVCHVARHQSVFRESQESAGIATGHVDGCAQADPSHLGCAADADLGRGARAGKNLVLSGDYNSARGLDFDMILAKRMDLTTASGRWWPSVMMLAVSRGFPN
jgi:hypothetical protein